MALSNTPFSVSNLLEFYWSLVNCHKCIDSVVFSLRACFAIIKMADGMEPFTVPLEQIGSQETLENSNRVEGKYRKRYEGLLGELVIAHLLIILGVFTTNVHKNFLVNIFKTFICLQQAFEIKQEESNQVRALPFLTLNAFLVWEIIFFF